MKNLKLGSKLALWAMLTPFTLPLNAQPIPTLKGQTCGPVGTASVTQTAPLSFKTQAGEFQASVDVHCDANGQPQGALTLSGLNLNGASDATMTATSFARLTSVAGAAPTAHLSGSCTLASPKTAATNDCRYWIMFSHMNRRTPDPQDVGIVGFAITRANGAPLASGAGRISPDSGKLTIFTTSGTK